MMREVIAAAAAGYLTAAMEPWLSLVDSADLRSR
jgi:hypothetical protein